MRREETFSLITPREVGTRSEQVRRELCEWTRDFLAQPHRDLGVPGRPVCPFVPLALKKDSLWLRVVEGSQVPRASVLETLESLRLDFPTLAPSEGRDAQFKAAIVAFPDLPLTQATGLIDQVQRESKGAFVEDGLMIGEFHALNATQGLHNPGFFPLRAPVPSLAIRYMVESDFPFLVEKKYSLVERERFVRAFLSQPFNHGVERARAELSAIRRDLRETGRSPARGKDAAPSSPPRPLPETPGDAS